MLGGSGPQEYQMDIGHQVRDWERPREHGEIEQTTYNHPTISGELEMISDTFLNIWAVWMSLLFPWPRHNYQKQIIMVYLPKGRWVNQKTSGDLFLQEVSSNQSELQSVKKSSDLTLPRLIIIFRARYFVSVLSSAHCTTHCATWDESLSLFGPQVSSLQIIIITI